MSADRTPEYQALERRVIELELVVRQLLGGVDEDFENDTTPAERAAITNVNARAARQRKRDPFLDRR
jgi:hypothetical protein